jgi:hypothetical protein
MIGGVARAAKGIAAAVRARPGVFAGVALAVLALDVFLPPLVLSLARKPVDYFTWNPWLRRLPDYLLSDPTPLGTKLGKIWGLALFWFSSDNPYGVEWGFSVTVSDLARFVVMALVIGAYFALWLHRRDRVAAEGPRGWRGAQGGALGVASSVLGLSSGGCTVMGCGAPVLPVVGLAFVGLSSTTLKWMAEISTIATAVVLAGLIVGVVYQAWRLSAPGRPQHAARQYNRLR